jgi:hypothetical protein
MKHLILSTVLLFFYSFCIAQAEETKQEISSYSANNNYFGIGATFVGDEDYRAVGIQLSYEKSINELFGIGIDGSVSKGKDENIFYTTNVTIIDFYPQIRAHTVHLFNLPKYLDLYVSAGLKIRFGTISLENEFVTVKDKFNATVLGYGVGAKYQVSKKIGFFLDYSRGDSFTVGLAIAIDKK